MRAIFAAGLLALLGCTPSEPPPVIVTMTTEFGDIEIEMAVLEAPLTTSNFLRLAEGGHLDTAAFYRVVRPDNDQGSPTISVIQGGLQAQPQPFFPIPHESTEQTGLRHTNGAISMARTDVGTASTEFFICVGDQPGLDHGAKRHPDGQGFAVFGYVVSGMDVVRKIHELPADRLTGTEYMAGQVVAEPVRITSVRVRQ